MPCAWVLKSMAIRSASVEISAPISAWVATPGTFAINPSILPGSTGPNSNLASSCSDRALATGATASAILSRKSWPTSASFGSSVSSARVAVSRPGSTSSRTALSSSATGVLARSMPRNGFRTPVTAVPSTFLATSAILSLSIRGGVGGSCGSAICAMTRLRNACSRGPLSQLAFPPLLGTCSRSFLTRLGSSLASSLNWSSSAARSWSPRALATFARLSSSSSARSGAGASCR